MTFEEIRASFAPYTAVDDCRQRLIHKLVIETKPLGECMAEIGVYRGGTSYLIGRTELDLDSKTPRPLFACDTFEGLPAPSSIDTHAKGDFSDVSVDEVRSNLSGLNVITLKGLFPGDAIMRLYMGHLQYSFVHLDVDLYQSTLDSLKFFYGCMVPGAILVSDDYKMETTPGVKQAFDEFMAGKPEVLVDSGLKSCYFKKL